MEEFLTFIELVCQVVSDHPQESAIGGGTLGVLVFISWLIKKIPWWVWMLGKLAPIGYGLYWLQTTYNTRFPILLEWLPHDWQKPGQKAVYGLMAPVYYLAFSKAIVPIWRKSWARRHESKSSTEVWLGANLFRGAWWLIRGRKRQALSKPKSRSAKVKQQPA